MPPPTIDRNLWKDLIVIVAVVVCAVGGVIAYRGFGTSGRGGRAANRRGSASEPTRAPKNSEPETAEEATGRSVDASSRRDSGNRNAPDSANNGDGRGDTDGDTDTAFDPGVAASDRREIHDVLSTPSLLVGGAGNKSSSPGASSDASGNGDSGRPAHSSGESSGTSTDMVGRSAETALSDSDLDGGTEATQTPVDRVFTGTVFDSRGAVVEGAEVHVSYSPASNLRATTGVKGRFRIVGPPQIAGMEIRVTVVSENAGGYLFDRFTWPDDAETVNRDCTLREGIELRIVVKNSEEKGVAGASLSLSPLLAAFPYLGWRKTTDSDGTATVRGVPPVHVSVRATRKEPVGDGGSSREVVLSLDSSSIDLTGAGDSTRVVVLHVKDQAETRALSGHVTDEKGNPLEGVEVWKPGTYSALHAVVTDAKGYYLHELDGGAVSAVHFEKEGYEVRTIPTNFGAEETDLVLDATLLPRASYFGRVLGTDGAPIRGQIAISVVRTTATGGGGAAAGPDPNARNVIVLPIMTVTLDDAGRFDLKPDNFHTGYFYRARVTDAALGAGHSAWVFGDDSRRVGPLEIRLARGAISGRVVDAESGEPVANAIVTLHPMRNTQVAYDWYRDIGHFTEATSLSDADGRYELSPVSLDGETAVFVHHADYGIQRFSSAMANAGGNGGNEADGGAGSSASTLNIALAMRVDWTGRVLFHDTTPVDTWFIGAAQTVDGLLGPMTPHDATAPDGSGPARFRLTPLAPGEALIRVGVPSRELPRYGVVYRWTVQIPRQRSWEEDLRLPLLIPVEIVFPERMRGSGDAAAKMVNCQFKLTPRDGGAVSVTFQSAPRDEPPPPDGSVVLLLPPGRFGLREILSSDRPPPSSTEMEVVILEGAANRIQIP